MRPDDPGPQDARPGDGRRGFDDLMDSGMDLPFDAELESLDEELAAAGQQARRMLYGRMHPTRVFANELRSRLALGAALPVIGSPVATAAAATAAAATAAALPLTAPAIAYPDLRRGPVRHRPGVTSGETQAVPRGDSAPAERPAMSPRALLAFLAILGFVALLAVGATAGSFELLLLP